MFNFVIIATLIKICNNFVSEKVHMKICKYALEVNRRFTNLAVIGELGRYPLYLEVLLNMIKYWARLTKLDNCLAVV
jgi:hypothetical protein